MKNDQTLTIIKPMAVKNNCIGKILNMITGDGFRISAMKMMQLTKEQAQDFYAVHRERPFYNDLVTFMTSGPVVVARLVKDNAVEEYRKLIGATNPKEADKGTIRELCGSDIQMNAVHGSDSNENAAQEVDFFFSEVEKF
jgi:nucleoside-diphosphate kinase